MTNWSDPLELVLFCKSKERYLNSARKSMKISCFFGVSIVPSAYNSYKSWLLIIITGKTFKSVVCSHNRAWRYYVESINNPWGFPATRCLRWRPNLRSCTWKKDAVMGFATDPRTRGIFYLRTNSRTPFARNLTDYPPKHFLVSVRLKDW